MTGRLTLEQFDALTVFGYDRWTVKESKRRADLIRSMQPADMRVLLNQIALLAPDLFDADLFVAGQWGRTASGQVSA